MKKEPCIITREQAIQFAISVPIFTIKDYVKEHKSEFELWKQKRKSPHQKELHNVMQLSPKTY